MFFDWSRIVVGGFTVNAVDALIVVETGKFPTSDAEREI